eukprot:4109827-Amphidinium_carterae.1
MSPRAKPRSCSQSAFISIGSGLDHSTFCFESSAVQECMRACVDHDGADTGANRHITRSLRVWHANRRYLGAPGRPFPLP